MSPVPPPPVGTFVPSDDWTDDPSFDFSPTASHFALPPSPSPSASSHHSHSSRSSGRSHTESPLRHSLSGPGNRGGLKLAAQPEVEEMDELDFDLPEGDALPPLPRSASSASAAAVASRPAVIQRPRSSTASSSSSMITRTVVGAGPQGVGTITKLGGGGAGTAIPAAMVGTVKARARALERAWEADVDFDDVDKAFGEEEDGGTLKLKGGLSGMGSKAKLESGAGATTGGGMARIRRMAISPPKRVMPGADALDSLDDLGFDLEEEDQATLKAGATLKAMLPPPRTKPTLITLSTTTPSSSGPSTAPLPTPPLVPPVTPPSQDPSSLDLELESDFALPLNLTNLSLAAQQPHSARIKTRPRVSNASTANTESWGSPGTSSGRERKWGWGSEDSPGPGGKRRSETSATSVSDGLAEKHDDKDHAPNRYQDELDVDEEDDLESGLVIPSPTFFSAKRADELNLILDRKRKPQYAPLPPPETPGFDRSQRIGDDSFEDGLVLDEPGVELSRHRLREKKRARDRPAGPAAVGMGMGGRRSVGAGSVGVPKTVVKERERAWEKQREHGWGRNTPVQMGMGGGSTRERTQSSLGLSLRSHSISATVGRDSPRRDEPALTGREKEAMRSRSGHLHSMLPPPPPIPSSTTQAPPTPGTSRLRHQKSHYHIAAPPQSPSLTRKQSLASLQDALAGSSASGSTHGHGGHSGHSAHGSHGSGAGTITFDQSPVPPLPPLTNRYHNSTSRLTMPTSSSRAKIRPRITSIFPRSGSGGSGAPVPEHTTPNSSASSMSSMGIHPISAAVRSRLHSVPVQQVGGARRPRNWGDGTELDAIDDLRVEEEYAGGKAGGAGMAGLGIGKPTRRGHESLGHRSAQAQTKAPALAPEEKRKKSGTGLATRKVRRKPAGLIKHLGGADKKKVVGEMTWNPATLRWEGNESCLRDFDSISSSSRPALITHYTGSSVGVGGLTSPVASLTPTAPRIVGDMQFDPIQMRWVSILSPDEDEPDPFEGMADDEDEETGGGATITRAAGRKLVSVGGGSGSMASSSTWSQRLASESSMAASVASWEERTRPDVGVQIPVELWAECREAEERHRKEVKGWVMRAPQGGAEVRERERREEKRLWEIRHLALKS
ncbi:hypothetical protein IAT38_006423 [Cryptococcus sp. DSM 104549]